MQTIDNPTTTPCGSCGRPIPYEPMICARIDFGKLLFQRCDDCQDALDRKTAEDERQRLQAEREAAVLSLLPPDLLDTKESHPDFNRALWRAVSRWRPTEEAFWLGIVGRAGRCKTRCLALASKASILRGHRLAWTTANRLFEASHDRTSKDRTVAALAREHLAECLHAPVLVIDDLGKNEWSNPFESQLFQILDHRKNHRLPLLYSSNAHPTEFSQLISAHNAEPIIGRLVDRTNIIHLR